MRLLYKDRGGIWITKRVLGIPFRASATWPFAILELYEDKIVIKVIPRDTLSKIFLPIYFFGLVFNLSKEYTIPLKEIDSVKRVHFFPIIGDGVKINHHANAPEYILFWSLKSSKHIIKLLNEKSIKEE